MKLTVWNEMDAAPAAREVLPCCGSRAWAEALAAQRPFPTPAALYAASDAIWANLPEDAWREAFDSHPRIGQTHTKAATSESRHRPRAELHPICS